MPKFLFFFSPSRVKDDPSLITRDYVRNSSLLINLAKAIGRLVISYKEIQQLAGFTTGIAQMQEVLADLKRGKLIILLCVSVDPQDKIF